MSEKPDLDRKITTQQVLVGSFIGVAILLVTALWFQPNSPTLLEVRKSQTKQKCTQSRQANGENAESVTGSTQGTYEWSCDPESETGYQQNDAKDKAQTSTDADLLAQERVAYWTRIIAALTALGIGILGWTLYETRAVAGITRNIGEAQVRAYLSCIGGEWCIDGEKLVIRPEFKNFGQSPAVNLVVFDASLSLNSKPGETFHDEILGHLEYSDIAVPIIMDDAAAQDISNGCAEFALSQTGIYKKGFLAGFIHNEKVEVWLSGIVVWDDVFQEKQIKDFDLRLIPEGDIKNHTDLCGTLSRKQ